MAIEILSLASGHLAEGGTNIPVLYPSTTPATPLTTIVRSIQLVNTGVAATTVNLYFNPAGSDQSQKRHIAPKDMTLASGASYIDDLEVTMGVNGANQFDQILGCVATGGEVDYVINGIQR